MNARVIPIEQRAAAVKWLSHKEIGKRVREIRETLGDGQEAFARRIGRPGSQSEISTLERGERPRVDANILMDIAGLVGLGVDYFQESGDDRERAEKLAAAKWMRRMADQLSTEALATPSAGAGAIQDADEIDPDGDDGELEDDQEPPAA